MLFFWRLLVGVVVLVAGPLCGGVRAQAQVPTERLLSAYPQQLERIDDNMLVWRDGTRMVISDRKGPKTPSQRLDAPDIADMLAEIYPAGAAPSAPAPDSDPGRARNWAFFTHMYGDCRRGEVARHLEEVVWLAGTSAAQRLRVTRINGVAEKLRQVSAELVGLPARFRPFLAPSAGTYICRAIAGTSRVSPHGLGIAIDIATRYSDYWQWTKADAAGRRPWRNRMPKEIVDVFERHGFIWGGRWSAFDTMHFEYRPELLP
jgi:hypothetical protein